MAAGSPNREFVFPESMQPIIEAIGLSAAISIVSVYAGGRIFIPKPENLREGHPIERLLGMPQALRLARRINGNVEIPRCQMRLLELRDEEICRRLEARNELGNPIESAFDLANAYGLSHRAVRAIAARKRATVGV